MLLRQGIQASLLAHHRKMHAEVKLLVIPPGCSHQKQKLICLATYAVCAFLTHVHQICNTLGIMRIIALSKYLDTPDTKDVKKIK